MLCVDTVEDVEDGLLYIQFLNLDTITVSHIRPFFVAAKNSVFP